jgi:O-antigen ligase
MSEKMDKNKTVSKIFLAGIVCSALVFSHQILDPTLTPRLICFSLFSVIILWFLRKAKSNLHLEWDIINSSYALFTVFCVLSILWSNTKSEALFESGKTVLAFTAFSFTCFCLKNNEEFFRTTLLKISIPVCFIILGFAFYQFIKIKVLDKEALYTITAINGHKNLFASFLFLNLFFLILGSIEFKGLWRMLSFVAIIFTITALIVIKTKAVWIGLTLVILIFTFLFVTRKIKLKVNFYLSLIICVALANLFFALVVPMGIEKGMSHNSIITNNSTPEEKAKELDNERLTLWLKSYEMIKKHPVIGVGMGNWQIYFPDATLKGIWRAEDLNFTFQRPHNDWLWILSETGWIGLNIFLVFVFSMLILLRRMIRASASRVQIEITLCIAFITGFFAVSFFDFPKERMEHLLWINIIFAFGYFRIKQQGEIGVFRKTHFTKSILLLCLVCVAFTSTIMVLRYRGEYYTVKMYQHRSLKEDYPAIKDGEQALSFAYRIDPTSVPVHWYTANSYANLKNYTKAQVDFNLAYRENPYNRNVLSDLGSSYFYTGNKELAKKYFNEALRISPRFDDPKLNLAAIYIQEKNWQMADSCLRTMFKDSERRSQYQKIVEAFLPKK